MTEILLLHHARGRTPGVVAFADRLRAAGHVVHVPDLYDGRLFDDTESGVAFAEKLGHQTLDERAAAAAAGLPTGIVYAGMSLGCALATRQVLTRPGARGALYLFGAVMPSWWDTTWPADVPAQAHQTADDPWREPEAEEGFVAEVPGAELFIYPGSGHLFADSSTEDYDEEAAALATDRILEFLAAV